MPTDVHRQDVQRLMNEGAQVVEVLPAEEYASEHLPGASSLPLKELNRDTATRLRADAPIVVYCNDTT